jgi:hypothetical protein
MNTNLSQREQIAVSAYICLLTSIMYTGRCIGCVGKGIDRGVCIERPAERGSVSQSSICVPLSLTRSRSSSPRVIAPIPIDLRNSAVISVDHGRSSVSRIRYSTEFGTSGLISVELSFRSEFPENVCDATSPARIE